MPDKIKWYTREWLAFKDGVVGVAGISVMIIAFGLLISSVVCFVYEPKTGLAIIAFAVVAALLFAPRRGRVP